MQGGRCYRNGDDGIPITDDPQQRRGGVVSAGAANIHFGNTGNASIRQYDRQFN